MRPLQSLQHTWNALSQAADAVFVLSATPVSVTASATAANR